MTCRGFGSVYKALNRESNQIVALKVMNIDSDEEGISDVLAREIAILKRCHSPYITGYIASYIRHSQLWVCQLYFYFVGTDSPFKIALEYCDAGSVHAFMMKTKKGLAESNIRGITTQILHGLNYLHSMRTIHRDVKAANILLKMNGEAKLGNLFFLYILFFLFFAILVRLSNSKECFLTICSRFWS